MIAAYNVMGIAKDELDQEGAIRRRSREQNKGPCDLCGHNQDIWVLGHCDFRDILKWKEYTLRCGAR